MQDGRESDWERVKQSSPSPRFHTQWNSPAYATYVQTWTHKVLTHPLPNGIHRHFSQKQITGFVQRRKLTPHSGHLFHTIINAPPTLPHLFTDLRCSPTTKKKPCWWLFFASSGPKRSEESFGFLQVHLLPAGQTSVLLSAHLQGFLQEQPCTPSAKSSPGPVVRLSKQPKTPPRLHREDQKTSENTLMQVRMTSFITSHHPIRR